ncbi:MULTISPECIES: DMT family transporter [Pseudonocardia]|uniref:Quaternary ammonium compound-resistance protein QacC n=2 Tax=Pseudonocardia TaxID=1847 RepID=A0A1Y2MIQ0_PSEAH|nr:MULTISPECIES: SMR family transporter [Pseudonocardia]OSY34849.1 Quaternary ammonium compound-resistance protein QacC [Pseudonocardia autotrophica]TDN75452.1 small multidrug resistance pump [Pseudonocardia autotrophica]BBF99418.1 QacE family quaternary ammonium compound efflux SMR transporter [Pseudonocardia autotrophica]GEC29344.1 QacE family quaternary ammonium compound efflux SMR transporter [Pseudonocardia saturnea]
MWGWLALAIGAEVTATMSLKASQGFSRLLPSLLTVAGYGLAFWSLAQALTRGMALGMAYGVWAAAGVAIVAVLGVLFLGESLTWVQVGGIVLIIGGVLALELGGSVAHA